jgi:hypothetical protein
MVKASPSVRVSDVVEKDDDPEDALRLSPRKRGRLSANDPPPQKDWKKMKVSFFVMSPHNCC